MKMRQGANMILKQLERFFYRMEIKTFHSYMINLEVKWKIETTFERLKQF